MSKPHLTPTVVNGRPGLDAWIPSSAYKSDIEKWWGPGFISWTITGQRGKALRQRARQCRGWHGPNIPRWRDHKTNIDARFSQ